MKGSSRIKKFAEKNTRKRPKSHKHSVKSSQLRVQKRKAGRWIIRRWLEGTGKRQLGCPQKTSERMEMGSRG